ncbi:hypothetical protein NECAME_18771, partial [Necator americanus]
MHEHVGTPVGRRFHRGPQLRLGEREHVERTARRGNAAAAHDFDLCGAHHELLAHTQAHFVGRIGNGGSASSFDLADLAARARHVGQQTKVAVAARRGDHRAAGVNARTAQHAGVDGLLQGERGTAGVANGREAAQERALGLRARGQVDEIEVGLKDGRNRDRGEKRMPVHVDEARHHHLAAAVDHAAARRVLRVRRAPPQLRDAVAVDDEGHAVLQRRGLAVEQAKVRERRGLRGGRGAGLLRAAELGQHRAQQRCAHADQEAAPGKIGADAAIGELRERLVAQARGNRADRVAAAVDSGSHRSPVKKPMH